MAAPIIYQDLADGAEVSGGLFAGKVFWLAQRIPARNAFKADIEANGGQITLFEKKADYCIADHLGRDRLPGYISYTFVEQSIKNGTLEDPQAHLVGPPVGSARPAGSISQPQKVGRAAYTAEEDIILYQWVRDHESNGGSVSGNELYKQLEAKYPRHTWQSWRDRYIKQLRPASQALKTAATSKPDHLKTSQSHAAVETKEPEPVDCGPEPELTPRQDLEELKNRHQDESHERYRKSNTRRTPPRSVEPSSSTMIQHTPTNITNGHEKTLKRIHGEDDSENPTEQGPSTKRRRSESPGPVAGTNVEPLEISSGIGSSQPREGYDENEDEYHSEPPRRPQEQHGPIEDVIQNQLQTQGSSDEDLGESGMPTPTIEREHVPPLLDEPDEPPSNAPTPRAVRAKRSAFDTQAILSSPTETLYLGALPLPQQDLSSPTKNKHTSRDSTLQHSAPDSSQSSASGPPESDASTTHSIQEFRRSLNEANESSHVPSVNPFEPLPLPHRASPTPSESSSQESGDPDPPLDVDEIEDFFALQRKNGFTTYEIRQALMHTRNRPVLAETVLEAWKAGKPLPNQRGIWSETDDEDVDSGDGVALARLERKHTLDGWGGITERTYFLTQWREG